MSRSIPRHMLLVSAALLSATLLIGADAPDQNLQITTRVDPSHTAVGQPVTLSISVEGANLEGVALQPLQLPAGWAVAAQQQAQQTSWRGGARQDVVTLTLVLVLSTAGTSALGPFVVEQRGRAYPTARVTVVVDDAPRTPPKTLEQPPGGRISL